MSDSESTVSGAEYDLLPEDFNFTRLQAHWERHGLVKRSPDFVDYDSEHEVHECSCGGQAYTKLEAKLAYLQATHLKSGSSHKKDRPICNTFSVFVAASVCLPFAVSSGVAINVLGMCLN